jgi:hypothetical protein
MHPFQISMRKLPGTSIEQLIIVWVISTYLTANFPGHCSRKMDAAAVISFFIVRKQKLNRLLMDPPGWKQSTEVCHGESAISG